MDEKCIIKGPANSGKTSLLIERYKYLVEQLHIPGNEILVLTSGRMKLDQWNSAILPSSTTKIWCHTYQGFIREELSLFYPLAAESCKDIVNVDIKPLFLSAEESLFLISKVIQARREKEGIFSSITASNEKIASELSRNLAEAALSRIPFADIGSRLFNALEIKDEQKRKAYSDMDDLLGSYFKRCMELGVFDVGLTCRLYTEHLLPHEAYKKNLMKRVRHLIADDLQEWAPAQLELVRLLAGEAETCFLACNTSYSSHLDELLPGFSARVMKGPDKKPFIERNPQAEMRSEMLEQLGDRLCRLIDSEGCKPSDIIVLSTYADIVTELVLSGILEKHGYLLRNISSPDEPKDSILCRSIITFAKLCHPDFRLFPSKDDLTWLVRLLFRLDPFRSSILARRAFNSIPFPELPGHEWSELASIVGGQGMEWYEHVSGWIGDYKKQNSQMPVDSFLQKALMEIFLSTDLEEDEIYKAKLLVDNAGRFFSVISKFGRNAGRDFIDMAGGFLKTFGTAFQPDEKLYGEHVILAAPATYLASAINRRILVVSGLSSNNWSRAIARELSNPQVLNESWKPGDIYTGEMEEAGRKKQLEIMLSSVLNKCGERLITFESLYDANGYENNGILPELLESMI